MSHPTGQVRELVPENVLNRFILRFKKRLSDRLEGYSVYCSICGEKIKIYINDPADLMCRENTCADVKERCRHPKKPKSKQRFLPFVRGSLVLAPRGADEAFWPGIIEDPPDSSMNHVINGISRRKPRAYHVTFIHASRYNTLAYLGGFIATKDIYPFASRHQVQDYRSSQEQKLAIQRAKAAVPRNLKERLLEFSIIPSVANRRGISLERTPPPPPSSPPKKPMLPWASFTELFTGKRKSTPDRSQERPGTSKSKRTARDDDGEKPGPSHSSRTTSRPSTYYSDSD